MKELRLIMKKNIGYVCLSATVNVLASFAMVFAGYSLSFLFRSFENGSKEIPPLIIDCAVVLFIWIAALFIYYIAGILQARTQRKLKNDMRLRVAEKIISIGYTDFTSKDSGNYISWLTNDVEAIAAQSFSSVFSVVTEISTAIFSIIALFYISVYIGSAAIILFFFVSVLPQLAARILQEENKKRSKAQEASVEAFKDSVMGYPLFLMSNLLSVLSLRIRKASDALEQANYLFGKRGLQVQVFVIAVRAIGQVILLALTILAAVVGSAPISAVLSVGNLSGSFFNSVGGATQGITVLKASKALWDKFRINKEPELKQSILDDFDEINLKNVGFCYGDKEVLRIDHMKFKKDGKYALIGESGSGKSTLAKLILGVLPDYSGSVLYGNKELKDISQESIFNNVAYVDQKVYLFQDTIRFNITLGKEYSPEEIEQVIERCRLDAYISSLPHGLDTIVEEDGKNMSGGQRQRIALARALLRNIRFIIIDEGTASLDDINALDIELSLIRDRSLGVVIITHNLREQVKGLLDAVYEIPLID